MSNNVIGMSLYDVQRLEDGSVRVTTDLSPEEMNALLRIGLLACFQQGVILASLADKMGLQINQEETDWQAELDKPEGQDVDA